MMPGLLYIDPGSSSFLVQALVVAALGVGFFFRNIWDFIRSIFGRNKKNDGPSQ